MTVFATHIIMTNLMALFALHLFCLLVSTSPRVRSANTGSDEEVSEYQSCIETDAILYCVQSQRALRVAASVYDINFGGVTEQRYLAL